MLDLWHLLNPLAVFNSIRDFIETGGWVLYLIMGATFLMWTFIIERYWYFGGGGHRSQVRAAQRAWEDRGEHSSWYAHRIRDLLVSGIRQNAEQSLFIIRTMVAICPLLGLLGTVTGMVDVFEVMALTGSSNARAMAAGVSKATIPTMAGMVAALSGLYFSAQLDKRAREEVQRVADRLELE